MSYPKSSVEFEVSIFWGYDTVLLFLIARGKNFFLGHFCG